MEEFMKLLNILFFSILCSIGSIPIQAMIVDVNLVFEEFSTKEIEEILSQYRLEIPLIVQLLIMQESLYESLDFFQTGKITKEEFVKRVNELDSSIIERTQQFNKKHATGTLRLKCSFDPIFNYSKNLLQNCTFGNGGLTINIDQKEKINQLFLNKYQNVRKACIALYKSIAQVYMESISNQLSPQIDTKTTKEKTAMDLITKDELGYNQEFSDLNFLNFLSNVCVSLEMQQICSEIIALRALALKEALNALENYKQTVEKTDLVDKGTLPIDELSIGKGIWHMKPLETVEGYYLGYFLNILSKDHNQFDALSDFARAFLNMPNEEVKKLAEIAMAKSNLDRAMDKYVRLVRLFIKLKDNQTPVVNILCATYEQFLKLQNPIIEKQINLFPHTFFNFINEIEHATESLNNAFTFGSRIKAFELSIKITDKFINEYQEYKELYFKNYKRLKKTLRSLVPKCPASSLYRDKAYLAGLSLDSYSLNGPRQLLITQQELNFITSLKKKDSEKLLDTKSTQATQQPSEAARANESSNKKKNTRSRKKQEVQRVKEVQGTASEDCSKTISQVTPLVTSAMKKLDIKETEKTKTNSNNVYLLDKKIAKKIIDEKNDMVIHIYRLKESDASTVKIMNYDDRVQLWFSNPKAALTQKNFADSDPRLINSEAFHSFPKEADKYALKWGFKRKSKNNVGKEVTEILVPGVIDRNGTRYEGFFVYVIDSKYLCFHRFFNECDWRNKLSNEWEVKIDE